MVTKDQILAAAGAAFALAPAATCVDFSLGVVSRAELDQLAAALGATVVAHRYEEAGYVIPAIDFYMPVLDRRASVHAQSRSEAMPVAPVAIEDEHPADALVQAMTFGEPAL